MVCWAWERVVRRWVSSCIVSSSIEDEDEELNDGEIGVHGGTRMVLVLVVVVMLELVGGRARKVGRGEESSEGGGEAV
jgi:hypothetical protein